MKILIADDDPIILHFLKKSLEQWGHEVVACEDGLQAWQVIIGDNPPQIAIMDWMMPGMEGPTVCRNIRELPDRDKVYVMFLSSRNTKEDIIEALGTGANDFMTKPVVKEELRARLSVGLEIVTLRKKVADLQKELTMEKESAARVRQELAKKKQFKWLDKEMNTK